MPAVVVTVPGRTAVVVVVDVPVVKTRLGQVRVRP